jgi:hypothetical protein
MRKVGKTMQEDEKFGKSKPFDLQLLEKLQNQKGKIA